MKSIIARTGAEMEESSGSLSSLEGEDGWAGEDRDGASQMKHHQKRHGMNADAEVKWNHPKQIGDALERGNPEANRRLLPG